MEGQTGYFQEDNGNKSSMRVMSFLSFLMACASGFLLLTRPTADPATGLYVFTGFLLGAFVPKAIQKFAEVNIGRAK